jgi:hypothetical protein
MTMINRELTTSTLNGVDVTANDVQTEDRSQIRER